MANQRFTVTRAAINRWVGGDMEGVRFFERLIEQVNALSIAAPVMLGTVTAPVFTVPPGGTLRGGRVTLRNLSASSANVTLSAGAAVITGQAIGPGEYFDVSLPDIASGTAVTASATLANAVTALQTGGDLQ